MGKHWVQDRVHLKDGECDQTKIFVYTDPQDRSDWDREKRERSDNNEWELRSRETDDELNKDVKCRNVEAVHVVFEEFVMCSLFED